MPKSALAHDRMDGALVADEFPFSILFEEKFSLDAMRGRRVAWIFPSRRRPAIMSQMRIVSYD